MKPPNQPSNFDDRHRNVNGEIDRKHGNTTRMTTGTTSCKCLLQMGNGPRKSLCQWNLPIRKSIILFKIA